jgi:hypothetical protein
VETNLTHTGGLTKMKTKRIIQKHALEIVEYYDKNRDIYNDIDVVFIDFDVLEITAETLKRIEEIENNFINIIHA